MFSIQNITDNLRSTATTSNKFITITAPVSWD